MFRGRLSWCVGSMWGRHATPTASHNPVLCECFPDSSTKLAQAPVACAACGAEAMKVGHAAGLHCVGHPQ